MVGITMGDALDLLQNELEFCYKQLVRIHADLDFINNDAPEYRKAIDQFNAAQRHIFEFKALWEIIRRIQDSKGEIL